MSDGARGKRSNEPGEGVPPLRDDQFERYRRHLTLPEMGLEGQRSLLDSKVLLIGAGGLGSPLALYLAAAGVGRLGLVDYDVVDASNLQRQVLYQTVFRARLFRRPQQVMRLVDDEQVPFAGNRLRGALGMPDQVLEAAQNQLLAVEGIFAEVEVGVVDQRFDLGLLFEAHLAEYAEHQVEAAQHFHQPLVHQRFRHHDQYPPCTFQQQLLMHL